MFFLYNYNGFFLSEMSLLWRSKMDKSYFFRRRILVCAKPPERIQLRTFQAPPFITFSLEPKSKSG